MEAMEITRLSSKGQLVVPKRIREELGLERGGSLRVELVNGRIVMEPLGGDNRAGWRRWRGSLKGSEALQEHLAEHRHEVEKDDEEGL